IVAEVRDRYGPIPPSVLNLADYGRIRILADQLGIESIDREGEKVLFRFRPQTTLDPIWLVSLVERRGDVSLVPPSGLRLNLTGEASPTPAKKAPDPRPAQTPGPWANIGRKPLTSSDILRQQRRGERERSAAPASWWTARATAGEVTPGFTKAELTRPAPQDPRGPDGVFTRVGALLSELVEGAGLAG